MKNSVLFLSLLILFSCQTCKNKNDSNELLIQKLSSNDIELGEPKPYDWLDQHKEKGQTYKQYINNSPVKANGNRNVIYLQPIGEFDFVQKEYIKHTSDYLNRFFNLKVEILNNISDETIPASARRIGIQDNEQLLATHIIYKIISGH